MTAAAKKILEDALALPDDERRRIAELLLDSISTDSTEEIEAAWVAEAVRRADELERGEVEALDGELVLEDLKTKFQSAARSEPTRSASRRPTRSPRLPLGTSRRPRPDLART